MANFVETNARLEVERKRLFDLAKAIPDRCRLVEASEGPWIGRKIRKLKEFGWRYISWFLAARRLRIPKEVTFPLFWRRRIRLPFSMDADFITLYLTGALGGREYKLTRFLIRNLSSDDIFYDVGAHNGFYTLLAAELVTQGEIHSFEPMPDIFRYLRLNCSGRVQLNNSALSNKPGESTLFIHQLGTSFSTINPEVVLFDPPRDSRRITVQCTTLDEYIKIRKPPTILKIDVEGAENKLIEGGAKFFSGAAPVIAMEVWGGEGGRRFSLEAVRRLLGFGYNAYALNEDGATRGPLSLSDVKALTADIAWDNLIFRRGP